VGLEVPRFLKLFERLVVAVERLSAPSSKEGSGLSGLDRSAIKWLSQNARKQPDDGIR
jgi:hypothetical protein